MSGVEVLEHEVARRRAELAVLEQALAVLKGVAVAAHFSGAMDFRGLGIVDATKRLIAERGEPLDTATIARELVQRGLETNAKNWVATVYATLDNSEQFNRIGGSGRKGRWSPRDAEPDGDAK